MDLYCKRMTDFFMHQRHLRGRCMVHMIHIEYYKKHTSNGLSCKNCLIVSDFLIFSTWLLEEK